MALSQLKNLLPKDERVLKSASKFITDEVAAMVVDGLYNFWKEAEKIFDTRGQRHYTKFRSEVFDPIENAYQKGVQAAEQEKNSNIKSTLIPAKDVDTTRPFSRRGSLPNDETLWKFVFCGHESINEPDSNATLRRDNKQVFREYERQMQAYCRFQPQKDRGRAPRVSTV